jgi:hypothetical protein
LAPTGLTAADLKKGGKHATNPQESKKAWSGEQKGRS